MSLRKELRQFIILLADGGLIMCKVNYSVLAMLITKESAHCSLTPLAIIVVITLIVFLTKYSQAQHFASKKKKITVVHFLFPI